MTAAFLKEVYMYVFLITDDFPCAQGEEIEIDMRLTRMFFVDWTFEIALPVC